MIKFKNIIKEYTDIEIKSVIEKSTGKIISINAWCLTHCIGELHKKVFRRLIRTGEIIKTNTLERYDRIYNIYKLTNLPQI